MKSCLFGKLNLSEEQASIFGLDKMPYEVFTMQHEPEKTDPKYFQTLMQKYNVKAEDIAYFEHNKDAVESAKSLGITSFYYDPNRKDLVELKNFLDSSVAK